MSDNPAHVTTFATVRYGRDGDARAWRNGLELLADVESESVVGLRLEWVAGLTGIRIYGGTQLSAVDCDLR